MTAGTVNWGARLLLGNQEVLHGTARAGLLSAIGFAAPLDLAQIEQIATLLRRATGRVTDATSGRAPT